MIHQQARSPEVPLSGPIAVDGKHFTAGGRRFPFRGVTYGTFAPRGDGALFPERERLKRDFAGMNEAGFTVVRTYTEPTADLMDLAADWSLRVLAGADYVDWRHDLPGSRRQLRRMEAEARAAVREQARRLRGNDQVLAMVLGNEIPADVVRWVGTDQVASFLADLADVVRQEDPDRLVTYGNYPTTEYLPLADLDFLMFNVFLERPDDFRRYLTRLHHLAGDRPLVLGEMGAHTGAGADAEAQQAEAIDWQMAIALERGVAGQCVFAWTDEWCVEQPVEGWRFGITRADRSPRPALAVAERWNQRTVADVIDHWPSISVVICAYNAEATMDECLRHTCALDYPGLEVLVVDDGSTDATADIARRHPRARLVPLPHAGLSVARNEGFRAATGDLVAYLDSDAYPTPEWPYYLALGLDSHRLGGVGGPNVPPRDDCVGAQRVARAPGGPVHVLVGDDRAEHVPGCNMAFWRGVLTEVGGCDPIYQAAGDDVDLCWKILDRDFEIGFHPAALVWHHRRAGLRPYLRQQRGYGKAEALVEARHPDRFTPAGTARWRGRIYDSFAPSLTRQRVYRGLYGAAAYQSVYGGGGHALDLAHQVGIPVAAVALATAPAAVVHPGLGVPAVAAVLLATVLGAVDVVRTRPPRSVRGRWSRLRFRTGVAVMHLLQPLWRTWGRARHTKPARRDLPPVAAIAGPVLAEAGGALVLALDRPRADLTADVITALRRAGVRMLPASGWEDHDARFHASWLVAGELLTSAHPKGCVTIGFRRRLRRRSVVVAAAVAAAVAALAPVLVAPAALLAGGDLARGWWRGGPWPHRVIRSAATQGVDRG
jgi:GT2 family glycosyltransferase